MVSTISFIFAVSCCLSKVNNLLSSSRFILYSNSSFDGFIDIITELEPDCFLLDVICFGGAYHSYEHSIGICTQHFKFLKNHNADSTICLCRVFFDVAITTSIEWVLSNLPCGGENHHVFFEHSRFRPL